jgi:hypothetical protein
MYKMTQYALFVYRQGEIKASATIFLMGHLFLLQQLLLRIAHVLRDHLAEVPVDHL